MRAFEFFLIIAKIVDSFDLKNILNRIFNVTLKIFLFNN